MMQDDMDKAGHKNRNRGGNMSEFMGLAISNWMIWVVMVLFIIGYFILTEALTKREEKKK
ncbi:hypothetical protein QWY14_14080 [Planococcus sp. N028]|uniref:Uncharacterized protein n=1 Tax=Planococcus shixiaomingii TaxID=3058393 RepID=A0ABT8N4Y2_9BACL|nr:MULTISPECIES: hypothetical protein [unclassified Planococcus (in: firmicutes)]MDN7242939.1 hypothetical protein [Planococcus sp. N028]WKA55437.1 hypothetical protein QWY21_03385 [Planococcus sp. N022]